MSILFVVSAMLSSTACRRSNDAPTAGSTEATAFLATVSTTPATQGTTTEHHAKASAESETTGAFVTETPVSDVPSPVSTAPTVPAQTEAFLTETTNADTRTRNPDKEPLPKTLPENREQQFTLLVEGKTVWGVLFPQACGGFLVIRVARLAHRLRQRS